MCGKYQKGRQNVKTANSGKRTRGRSRGRGRGRGSSEKQVFFESSFQLAMGSTSLMLEAGQSCGQGTPVSQGAVGCAPASPHTRF